MPTESRSRTAAPAPVVCGRCYAICGVDVCLAGDTAEVLEAGAALLEHFGLEPITPAAICDRPLRLEITRRVPPDPPRTAVVIARHMDLIVRSSGDLLFVDDGRTVALIDLGAGTAQLHTSSWPQGPMAERSYLIFIYTLLTLLRRRGLVPLHAAALERRRAGVLLVAPSGSGKSTLTVVFLQNGWSVVSDDSVLLRHHPAENVTAHGLRRDLFLRSPESDFPELADAWTSSPELDRSKRRLVVERTFPGRVSRICTPRCILLPELSSRSESHLVPCPPDETLYRLLDHSTFADLESGPARVHIEVLGKLVRQAPSFVLEAAGDLLRDPGCLSRMVEPLLADCPEEGPNPGNDTPEGVPE